MAVGPASGLLDVPLSELPANDLLHDNAHHTLIKVAVVGRDKAGKSALIRTLCGLEPAQQYVETAGIEVQQLLRGDEESGANVRLSEVSRLDNRYSVPE
jgi:GTPase SAR1 family protein